MKLELSARLAALTVGGAFLLAACTSDGGGNLPTLSPSRTADVSPTATAPTATRTTVTLPTVSLPTQTLPTRTTSGTAEPTSLPQTTTTPPTSTPTEPTQTSSPTEPTATPTPSTPTPAETTSPASDTSSPTTSETTAVALPSAPSTTVASESVAAESQGVPAWVWWLLAAMVIALAIAVPVLLRRRRMDRWLDEFARVRAEVAWLARELIPQLRQFGARQLAAGGLEVSSARIVAAEDRLTALIASAPDDVTLERSRILRDAVRDAHARLDAAASSGTDETLAIDLDEIAGELEAALATTAPAGITGGAGTAPGTTPGSTDQSL